MKQITFENVHYSWSNFGFGLTSSVESLVHFDQKMLRSLPYKRQFQAAITFEVNPDQHETRKLEYTVFEYLSAIGGLSSILVTVSQALGNLDDTHVYVTSAMIGHEDDDQDCNGRKKIEDDRDES